MKWNHAFSLGFAVPDSQYEDWEGCLKHEKDKVVAGLLSRLKELVMDDREFLEALEGFDTYEEVT
jgi:hypothetical protein